MSVFYMQKVYQPRDLFLSIVILLNLLNRLKGIKILKQYGQFAELIYSRLIL